MIRRHFLSSAASAALAFGAAPEKIDAAWFLRTRRFAKLPQGRVAYVEAGRGPVALFLHGYPLNGFQWRGAIERLRGVRRCLAPDFLSLGYTEAAEGQAITPPAQAEMLAALLDSLRISAVDLVANDSGGLVAQLFLARYPQRVRSLLLTDCDVDENNPPVGFVPLAEAAKRGTLADKFFAPMAADSQLARSARGLGQAYTYPEKLTDETLGIYLRPLVSTPERKKQLEAYAIALGENELVAQRQALKRWTGPARMVWGTKDSFFPAQWADWLDHTLPGSRGVRRVEGANLFFPEEMPDVIAEEARGLWRAG